MQLKDSKNKNLVYVIFDDLEFVMQKKLMRRVQELT